MLTFSLEYGTVRLPIKALIGIATGWDRVKWNAKLSRDPVISKPRNLKSAYILDNILLVLKSEVRESYRIM